MTGTRRDVLRCFAVSDGFAWQNAYVRSGQLPAWTRRRRRYHEERHEEHGILEVALPFALNQSPEPLRFSPGPRSEWLAFQLGILIASDGPYDRDTATEHWLDLAARRTSLRLSIAQSATLRNLERGLQPPQSGHDNPHYFSDDAMVRSVALALTQPPDAVATAVRQDAAISNAEDGVWAAEAYAVALSAVLHGATAAHAVSEAVAVIPTDSWLHDDVERARTTTREARGHLARITALHDETWLPAYDYGTAAPMALARTLAIVEALDGDFMACMATALALPRTSASVTPLTAALCAAMGTGPPDDGTSLRLAGHALPHLEGVDVLDRYETLQQP